MAITPFDIDRAAVYRLSVPVRGSFHVGWTVGFEQFPFAGGLLPALSNSMFWPNQGGDEGTEEDPANYMAMGYNCSCFDGYNAHIIASRVSYDAPESLHLRYTFAPSPRAFRYDAYYDSPTSLLSMQISEDGTVRAADTRPYTPDPWMQYIVIRGSCGITGWLDDIMVTSDIPEPATLSLLALLALSLPKRGGLALLRRKKGFRLR